MYNTVFKLRQIECNLFPVIGYPYLDRLNVRNRRQNQNIIIRQNQSFISVRLELDWSGPWTRDIDYL